MIINDEEFKPKFYSTHQVAAKLDLTDSTVRFYCKRFEDFIDVKRLGKDRQFTEENIEELKFIKQLLKENGFSIRQVEEYLSKGKINASTTNNNASNDNYKVNNQAMNELSKEIVEKVSSHIDFKFKELNDVNKKNNEEIIELISSILEKKIDEKIAKLDIYQKLKAEQEKNMQLEKIIIELYNNKNTEQDTNRKKAMKKNLFDTFR